MYLYCKLPFRNVGGCVWLDVSGRVLSRKGRKPLENYTEKIRSRIRASYPQQIAPASPNGFTSCIVL